MEANADQIAEDIADAVKDATEELKAEIARLTAERDQALVWRDAHKKAEAAAHDAANAAIAQRDQALARAAAAAMEMRERAAQECVDCAPSPAGGPFSNTNSMRVIAYDCRDKVRNLPIDPDAQKALDKLLAEAEQRGYANAMRAERKDADQRISKAREDAIREAASVSGQYLTTESDELLADMWREDILALLNDGGRDE